MSQPVLNGFGFGLNKSNDSDTNTNNVEANYAIKWGQKVEITDDLIAQICPADLTDRICDFDYVMPNGCDHNCEMLRRCEAYVSHYDYECPNTSSSDLPCPYVHGVPVSCSYINHQFTLHLEKKALEESLGKSWKPTVEELKREANNKTAKARNDLFHCTMKIAGDDCSRGHDHQIARLASYALLQKHQHAGRIVRGTEKETFEEKMARGAEQQGTQPKNTVSDQATIVPADATLTLVVKNMSYETTQDSLKAAFGKYGDIKRTSILAKDGTPKGLGFVDFIKLEDAAKALRAMQGFELDGRALRVTFKGDKSAGGSSRACFSCGQEGHISAHCPSKEPNQGGGGGGYDVGQDQTAGAGWTGPEVDIGGNSWEGAGQSTTQESPSDWDTVGNEATQSLPASNNQW